ncbi:Unannotated [Lentimonas sp. CC4]|nr:Unannotated [Lentimonas sp. CC4]CAA6686338.1 Unannotated [Lentimonas sp. CC6]CAA7076113.1 Unannotated [Lentimonas sp. CC4]CAA7170894.1 Unannotated [Lentimonas sp. CC21]CAA7181164.1 Unannotated [Lentimonas sp. CC8]
MGKVILFWPVIYRRCPLSVCAYGLVLFSDYVYLVSSRHCIAVALLKTIKYNDKR